MSSSSSPEAKRKRLHDESSATIIIPPIEAILPDSLIKPVIFEHCVIATLGDKRRLSAFIQEINRSFPLPTFQHLKRVRNGQVLLFPLVAMTKAAPSQLGGEALEAQVKAHLINNRFPESLMEACSGFRVEDLPVMAPQLKSQYEEVVQRWPCKFHEDKTLEKLFRNENFDQRETRFHCRMMKLCLELRSAVQSDCVALAFDPAQNEIVALGWKPSGRSDDNIALWRIIPSGHSVMRVIDNVALHQGGGAWKTEEEEHEKALRFAKEEFLGFAEMHLERADALKFGSYLCTGFDMYLTDEPCLMCSMALVHSRVRRIFFKNDNAESGALGGGNQLKLHGVKELNHHYQVFRVNAIE